MIFESISAFLFRKKLKGATFFHEKILRGGGIKIKTRHGVKFKLDPRDHIDRCVIAYGYYESEVLEAILQNLPPQGTFWDVGANFGLHAVTVGKTKPQVKICCFEPNPDMAQRIREHGEINNLSIEVHPVALDKNTGEAEFYLRSGNSGMGSLHNWDKAPCLKTIRVKTARADDLSVGKKMPPNVIKIDVEGNEQAVLLGMHEILQSNEIRAVIFEDSPEDNNLKKYLRDMGFKISALSRKEPTHHNLENFVALKN